MEVEGKKRMRCTSFTAEEKLLIANICARYKNILENKKTDHVSSEMKNRVWKKISTEINSAALSTIYRTPEVLKRFYENRKREVRKIAAEEKKEIFATGGGKATKVKKEECHDIILSMMNSKTVYGLENNFDGDAEPLPENSSEINSSLLHHDIEYEHLNHETDRNDIEIVYETCDSSINEQGTRTWKKYIPSDLRKPLTASLVEEDLQEPGLSGTKQKTNTEETNTSQSNRKTLSTSRRRPTPLIKSLTRSDLATKYDQLLNDRLELTGLQKTKIEEELSSIKSESALRVELLQLQIEVEKEKLNKLRSNC